MTKIGILQPGYWPWLGFFEQIYQTDIFVLYDDVQYDKHGWRNRNRIKAASGPQWLTVPVLTKGLNQPLVKDVRINNNENWRRKHLTALSTNYRRAEYYDLYIEYLETVYHRDWAFLIDLNLEIIFRINEWLGLTRPIVLSSELGITGDRDDRLIDICHKFNADIFYEGAAGKSYIDTGMFVRNGIMVSFQDYDHPVYRQLFDPFVPYLSVLDLLMNMGSESLEVLVNGKTREDLK